MHPTLTSMIPIATGIANTFGENTEVVLHDLSNLESSLCFIVGNVTGRQIGAPCTDLILEQLKAPDGPKDLCNYSIKLADGRQVKSSILFVRDEDGKAIGCLGINFDLTDMTMAKKVIERFCATEQSDGGERHETFSNSIGEIIHAMIMEARDRAGKSVPYMDKDDKVKIIEELERKGAFMVKGAVALVAKELGVSSFTVYNYLKETGSNESDHLA